MIRGSDRIYGDRIRMLGCRSSIKPCVDEHAGDCRQRDYGEDHGCLLGVVGFGGCGVLRCPVHYAVEAAEVGE